MPISGGGFVRRVGPRRPLFVGPESPCVGTAESGRGGQGDAGGGGARGAGAAEAASSVRPGERVALEDPARQVSEASEGCALWGEEGGALPDVGAVGSVEEAAPGVGLVAAFHQESSLPVRDLVPAGVASMPGAVAAEALFLSLSLSLSLSLFLF